MVYLIISYTLIAVFLTGYIAIVVRRTRTIERALQEEN